MQGLGASLLLMAVCAKCGHDVRLHMPGSVCGRMHCYCREFVPTPSPAPAPTTKGSDA